jgi:hypothetical protein
MRAALTRSLAHTQVGTRSSPRAQAGGRGRRLVVASAAGSFFPSTADYDARPGPGCSGQYGRTLATADEDRQCKVWDVTGLPAGRP